MSLKELKGKAEDRLDLDKLPESIEAMLVSYVWQSDKTGRMTYFCNFVDRKGQKFTQKYSPYHLDAFVKACEAMGADGFKQLEGSWILYQQHGFNMGFPRYVPVEVAAS